MSPNSVFTSQTKTLPPSNFDIAHCLDTMAELLEAQDANPHRVRAYREGAQAIRELKMPVHRILQTRGVEGLRLIPHIGESLSRSIEQLIHTGKISLLMQLRGEVGPEDILATVPGLGPILASRIRDRWEIESLLDLERAAHDGRLAQVPGFGPNRLRAVRESLAGRLHRGHTTQSRPRSVKENQPPLPNSPPVCDLLEVDDEYRRKARAGQLHRIAPRRFNPTGEAWLPVIHTQHRSNHYSALFSNTSRAHQLGTTRDWVVIYRDDHDGAGQWTIITALFGELKGKRVVRGREKECADYYASSNVKVRA